MQAEAEHVADGRVIYGRGLKYLLADMYGLRADAGVPSQPLFDLRRETAKALRGLGWVAPVTRNSGRYELVRRARSARRPVREERSVAPAPPRLGETSARVLRPPGGDHGDSVLSFFTSLAEDHKLRVKRGLGVDGMRWIGLYSAERPPMYRYAFAEWWAAATVKSLVAWVLLNPGVGDTQGTPRSILGRCRNLTRSWGFGGLVIVNLFAYRARDPNKLPTDGAVGPANDSIIKTTSAACGRTVAAWGDGGRRASRSTAVRPLLQDPLSLTKNGKRLTDGGEPFYPKAIAGGADLLPLT